MGHMSLRGRVVALLALMFLISVSLFVAVSWQGARSALAEELGAARTGGLQSVRSSFEDLPRSEHLERDLRQLVATFNGNRHLSARVVDRAGPTLFGSMVPRPAHLAPGWFGDWLEPDLTPLAVEIPDKSGRALVLRPQPANDLAASWSATVRAAEIFTGAAAIGFLLVYWMIGRALAPLGQLSQGLDAIGLSGYRERVSVEGPPELHSLQRGFNAMAERLAEIDARNRALEAQILTIQDEERAEIARDLHDEIGPHLFAVALDAEIIGRCANRGQMTSIPDHVHSIQSAVGYMQRQVRELIARLRPTRAAELGLEAAVADLIAFWQARQPQVTFASDLNSSRIYIPEPYRDIVYRVIQEAIANALRHAETTEISISLALLNGRLSLTVANKGTAKQSPPIKPGLGLISMRERVQAVGGGLQIDKDAEGWTIIAVFGRAKNAFARKIEQMVA